MRHFSEIKFKKEKYKSLEFFRMNLLLKNSKCDSEYINIIKDYDFNFADVEGSYGYFFCDIEKVIINNTYEEMFLGYNHPICIVILLFLKKIYKNNYKVFSVKDLSDRENFKSLTQFMCYISNETRFEEILDKYNLSLEYRNFEKKYIK